MSKTFRESAIAMLEAYREAPPEGTQEELQDTYKGITLEDAKRVKDGLLALLDSKTREEQRQRQREYTALHAELKKKYKKYALPFILSSSIFIVFHNISLTS